jgi:FtsZ-binding cell division protein ZapB
MAVVYMDSAREFQEHRDRLLRLLSKVDKVYVMFDTQNPYLTLKKSSRWINRLGCVLPSPNWDGCSVKRCCVIGTTSTVVDTENIKTFINLSNVVSIGNILSELDDNNKKNFSEIIRATARRRRLSLREEARQAREDVEGWKTRYNAMFGILSSAFGNKKATAFSHLGHSWRFLGFHRSGSDQTLSSPIEWDVVKKAFKDTMSEIYRREGICSACKKRMSSETSWTDPGKECLRCKAPEIREFVRRTMKSTFMYEALREGDVD